MHDNAKKGEQEMAVTMQQIADLAGVSRGTVDRALNDRGRIRPEVAEKIKNFDGKVFYTRDTHDEKYLETQEGKNLLVKHCIRGTDGWKLTPEIDVLCEGDILNKSSFGSIELGFKLNDYRSNLRVIKNERVESITLIGVCTDICVISNAMILKAFFPDKPIIVDAACCAGSTPEGHKNALAVMKTCQIQIENEV